jgi:ParB family chromosome partitioning protein
MSRILTVPLADIVVGKRLRDVDTDYVHLLAESIRAHIVDGKPCPVPPMLCARRGQKFRLVAGAHRHGAWQEIGARDVEIMLVEGNDLQLKLIEIDENLCRRELNELDRAAFLAERQAVWEELHPETKHGGDRKSDEFRVANLASRFSRETAEKLGLSERTIRRAVARHRKIDGETRAIIKATWIADSGVNLDALARLSPGEQKRVVKLMLREKEPLPSVGAALKHLRGTQEPADPNPRLTKMIALWRGADSATRAAFLVHLDELGELAAWAKRRAA